MTVNRLWEQLHDYPDDTPVILSFYHCDPWSTYYTISEIKVRPLGEEQALTFSIEDVKKSPEVFSVKKLISALHFEDNAAKSVYVYHSGLCYPIDRARTQIMNEHTPDAQTFCVLDMFH